jgi:hypothetical protein
VHDDSNEASYINFSLDLLYRFWGLDERSDAEVELLLRGERRLETEAIGYGIGRPCVSSKRIVKVSFSLI